MNKHEFTTYAQRSEPLPYEMAFDLGAQYISSILALGNGQVEHHSDGRITLSKEIFANFTDRTAELTAFNTQMTLGHQMAAEMIAGIAAAVFEKDIQTSPEGFFNAGSIECGMENCGMGGDQLKTPNVSCLSAVCASSLGVTMLKHGSRSHSNSYGSSDFFERYGVLDSSVSRMREVAEKYNFGYIEAEDVRFKRIHLGTMNYSHVCHLNHLVGPITSPFNPSLLQRRVLGVNQNVDPALVVGVYQILNQKGITNMKNLVVVRGWDEARNKCMDEVSITTGGTEVVHLQDGSIKKYDLYPSDFGLQPRSVVELTVPKGGKREVSEAILRAECTDGRMDLVCANTAILLNLADPSISLPDATEKARQQFLSGAVHQHLQLIQQY